MTAWEEKVKLAGATLTVDVEKTANPRRKAPYWRLVFTLAGVPVADDDAWIWTGGYDASDFNTRKAATAAADPDVWRDRLDALLPRDDHWAFEDAKTWGRDLTNWALFVAVDAQNPS